MIKGIFVTTLGWVRVVCLSGAPSRVHTPELWLGASFTFSQLSNSDQWTLEKNQNTRWREQGDIPLVFVMRGWDHIESMESGGTTKWHLSTTTTLTVAWYYQQLLPCVCLALLRVLLTGFPTRGMVQGQLYWMQSRSRPTSWPQYAQPCTQALPLSGGCAHTHH